MVKEKVKEIKKKLQKEIFMANSFGDKLRKVATIELRNLLTLINELESENKVLKNKLGLYQGLLDEIGDKNLQLKDRIAELEKQNEALQKGVKRLKKRYEEIKTKNADECVKKFCETIMYHEQEKLVNENQQLKDRIAELEKIYDRQVRIINDLNIEVVKEQEKLPKFAKRLKEKAIKQRWQGLGTTDIDETLKEFINGKD